MISHLMTTSLYNQVHILIMVVNTGLPVTYAKFLLSPQPSEVLNFFLGSGGCTNQFIIIVSYSSAKFEDPKCQELQNMML